MQLALEMGLWYKPFGAVVSQPAVSDFGPFPVTGVQKGRSKKETHRNSRCMQVKSYTKEGVVECFQVYATNMSSVDFKETLWNDKAGVANHVYKRKK